MLLVDTGVLLAAADQNDPDHHDCARLVTDEAGPLITTPLVVTEAGYLIERQLGPAAEAGFYQSLAAGDLTVESMRAGLAADRRVGRALRRPPTRRHRRQPRGAR